MVIVEVSSPSSTKLISAASPSFRARSSKNSSTSLLLKAASLEGVLLPHAVSIIVNIKLNNTRCMLRTIIIQKNPNYTAGVSITNNVLKKLKQIFVMQLVLFLPNLSYLFLHARLSLPILCGLTQSLTTLTHA